MTDRYTFAAAALTGLLARGLLQSNLLAADAYRVADAMLRERCRGGGDCPVPDNAANLDAAPAARAAPSESSAPLGKGLGTGDTQSFDAYARFAGSVMNWISEATSAADWSSDGGRKIMADACCQCWDAFDRIAYPTDHGAAPKPIASEQEPVAWGVAGHKGLLYATAISRMDAVDMQSEHECDTAVVPLYRHPPRQDSSQKNSTLTDAEQEAVTEMAEVCDSRERRSMEFQLPEEAEYWRGRANILRGLLAKHKGGEL